MTLEEMRAQLGDVRAPLAQGRHFDLEDIEAVIQILAEFAVAHGDFPAHGDMTRAAFEFPALESAVIQIHVLRLHGDLAAIVRDIDFDVGGNRRSLEVVGASDASAGVAIADFDDIANFELEARNVNDTAVDRDMAV